MSETVDRYILGCNARWPIVRIGLWLALGGAVLAAVILWVALFRAEAERRDVLLFLAGSTIGIAFGMWAVALNRSRVNDIVGTDVWTGPTHMREQ